MRHDGLRSVLRRFVSEHGGQDLVEYALLVALIGVTAAASAPLIRTALAAAYTTWNIQTQDHWEIPNPSSTGS